jgi:two-component system, chemotaxis family, protein-glutamate methylesterase/glutaminase
MTNRDILAIGTSAGGVEALRFLVQRLPREFPASVLVTIHLPSHVRSSLDEVLSGAGPLPATFARNAETIRKSRIYIAPADRHLLLDGDHLFLGEGPRENNARPAIDPMMRSAAMCCGPRSVGAILTGTLGDGASGLWALGRCGGVTVVQDPKDASFSEMPVTALNRAKPDHVVSLADMPALFDDLANQPPGAARQVPASLKYELAIAKSGRGVMGEMDHIGRRSVLGCPDCGGVMWEIDEGELIRYRCHVGHAYTAEVMSLAVDDGLRRALATALRALEERVALARKLERQAAAAGHRLLAENWAERGGEFELQLNIIRDSIRRMDRIAANVDRQQAAE